MKLLVLLVVVGLVGAVLWLAGEQHRENCIRDGKRECTVLPWESGKPKPDSPTWRELREREKDFGGSGF